jgi:hypothetical protein
MLTSIRVSALIAPYTGASQRPTRQTALPVRRAQVCEESRLDDILDGVRARVDEIDH